MAEPSLDTLDPPPWGPAPVGATFLVRTCHELHGKPVDSFTVEGLRLMIGQQIGLKHLVPIAVRVLRDDPLADGDYFPGDLLASVLRVDGDFWQHRPALREDFASILATLKGSPSTTNLEPVVRELIAAFPQRQAPQ